MDKRYNKKKWLKKNLHTLSQDQNLKNGQAFTKNQEIKKKNYNKKILDIKVKVVKY